MAVVNKPLRQRRRTAQRGKPMSQSQRWGKVVTTMPVPEGDITTSEILDTAIAEAITDIADQEYITIEQELAELEEEVVEE